MVEIKSISPRDPKVIELIRQLDDYQNSLYPAESNHLDDEGELEKEHVTFVGAFISDRLMGIGAVKLVCEEYAEIKRMFVLPDARGKGVGKAILQYLEQVASTAGLMFIRLETGIHQDEAMALYRCFGYRKRSPFGDYPEDPLSVHMEKVLIPSV